jgi:hypothetical protein
LAKYCSISHNGTGFAFNLSIEACGGKQMKPCDENLQKLIQLTREMLALADEGDMDRIDDSCGIIYGILRDSSFRLRKIAMDEWSKHADTNAEQQEKAS